MTERLYTVATAPFEAARYVAILPTGHRARRLHGHSFLARVWARLPAAWAPFPGAETDTLVAHLTGCLTPLDYALLNDHLPVPTDENLARWVQAHLAVPGVEQVGIQSTHNQGADLDESDHAHLWRRFRFEAAHQLPNVLRTHKCGRMHGHGFEIILHADQHLSGQDMGIDFDHLDTLWAPFQAELHHACLNDLPGLDNPTSELLATWIWQRLKPALPALSWVTVYETVSAGCHFDGHHYRLWKEQRFEGALRLSQPPRATLTRVGFCAQGNLPGVRVHGSPLSRWAEPRYQGALCRHGLLGARASSPPASVQKRPGWLRSQVVPKRPLVSLLPLVTKNLPL